MCVCMYVGLYESMYTCRCVRNFCGYYDFFVPYFGAHNVDVTVANARGVCAYGVGAGDADAHGFCAHGIGACNVGAHDP